MATPGFNRHSAMFVAACLAVILVVCRTSGGIAQAQRGENLITAKEFLRVAYPELSSSSAPVRFILDSWLTEPLPWSSFHVRVNESDKDFDIKDASALLLDADFTFDHNGRIEKYFAGGRLVRDVENDKLDRDIADHERWSDEDITRELARRGARFGPGTQQQLLSRVPIRAWEPMLGELSFISLEFQMPALERGHGETGNLCWIARYQSSTGLAVLTCVVILVASRCGTRGERVLGAWEQPTIRSRYVSWRTTRNLVSLRYASTIPSWRLAGSRATGERS